MPEYIVGGKADREEVGGRPGAELFIDNQLFSELKLIVVRERSGSDYFIEAGWASVPCLAWSRRSQDLSVVVLPLAVPVLVRPMGAVEVPCPLWEFLSIVGGSDPCAALEINPVSAIAGKTRRQ